MLLKKDEATIKVNLQNFSKNGILDGSKLSKEWFPQISANVFISHSHKDENYALMLAGFLHKELGIKCFIDSCVWGYSENLLKAIDNEFCKNGDGTYNYKLRNQSTAHVYMMLTVALAKMINNCECLFFLNTPNSILPEESINKTLSPWLYTELSMSTLIEKRTPEKHRQIIESFSRTSESMTPKMSFDVDFGLPELTFDDIEEWGKQCKIYNKKHSNALDLLYSM